MDSFNRQACFNELSYFSKKEDNEDVLHLYSVYAEMIKVLIKKGFNGVRYEHGIASLCKEGERNIFDLKKTPRGKDIFLFILSTARNPYIDPDTQEEDRYINEDFEVLVNEEWCVGQGFAAAYLLDTIVVSLCTHSKWNIASYIIRRRQDEMEQGFILNATTSTSVETEAINLFISQRKPIVLKQCDIPPKSKAYKFREDHGIDELIFLWNKLRNCEYIVSAINSLKFNPKGRDFVEECFADGKIHIRLVDSDAGYGMVIQTTGETLQETKAIGEIITRRYRKTR